MAISTKALELLEEIERVRRESPQAIGDLWPHVAALVPDLQNLVETLKQVRQ